MDGSRYDVFLSHTSSDKPVVEELARILRERGIEPWLDVWHLVPGAPWQEAIEKALESCATVAVCLGPSGTGPWQNEEMRAAINRRVTDREGTFRVIPVLLPGAERGERSRLPTFLTATTWVEFRDTLDDKRALHRLVCGIRGVEPDPELENVVVVEGVSPYRGLQFFDVEDARFFFGREALTQWLLDKLRPASTENRFLAIVGPSGSGKSSLARAGLLAALKKGEAIPGSQDWPVAICKPGAEPLVSLGVALTSAGRLGDASTLANLIGELGKNPQAIDLTTRLALHDAPAERRFVVLVDQFEEVFTLCSDEAQRRALIDNLLHAATASEGRTVIVLTLRADFYGRCAAYPNLAVAVSDRQILAAVMTREELRRAIERPALLVGCELESGLSDRLIEKVDSQPGSLPLLQHALLLLWDRRKGRRLTVEAYREIGGVEGALETYAEGVYSALSEGEKESCRQVLLRLVQIEEGTVPTRRQLFLEDLKPMSEPRARVVEQIVNKLVDARLLTSDKLEENPIVELIHEALITGWTRLGKWIETNREALLARRQFDDALRAWAANGRDPSYLYRGTRLSQAEKWAASHSAELSRAEQEFLNASLALRNEEQTQTQRFRRLAAGVVAGLVLTVLAGSSAFWVWRIWQRQMRILSAHDVAEKVRSVFPNHPSLGLLLAAESVRVLQREGEANSAAEEETLRWALGQSSGRALESGRVTAVALTADRRFLVTAGVDGTARIWDLTAKEPATSGRVLTSLDEGTVSALALTTDRRWLLTRVTSGAEPHLFLRDLSSQEDRRSLPDEDWLDTSDPFSPDGRWLITNQTGKAILRDLQTHTVHDLKTEDLRAVAFSPDGRWLAMASNGNPVALRALRATEPTIPVRVLPGSEGPLESLAFGPDGYWLAASDESGTARAWRLDARGRPGAVVLDQEWCKIEGKSRVDFGSDGKSVVLMGETGSCLWKTEPGLPFAGLRRATTGRRAAISADGRLFILPDDEGTAVSATRLLEKGLATRVLKHIEPIRFIGLSSDDRWIVIQGGDEPPRLLTFAEVGPKIAEAWENSILAIEPGGGWLAEYRRLTGGRANEVVVRKLTGEAIVRKLQLGGHVRVARGLGGIVMDAVPHWTWAVGPGGAWVAAVNHEGRLLLWRLLDGELRSVPGIAAPKGISTLVFSPDGRWLAAGTRGGDVLLWDLRASQPRRRELIRHPEGVTAVAFSPEGQWLATAGRSGRIRGYGLSGDELRPEVVRDPDEISIAALALSPRGEWLAAANEAEGVVLWKPGEEERTLGNRSGVLQGLAFSPDGFLLAGFSRSGFAQLWRLDAGTATGSVRLTGHRLTEPAGLAESEGRVHALAFSTDGKLVTVGSDGLFHQWEPKLDELLKLACRTVGRNLTEEEWKEYFKREPYLENEPCPEL